MSIVTYQNTNILDDFFSDGIFTYVLLTTFIKHQEYFPEISNYIKTYISNWIPTLNFGENRLAFNSSNIFEIAFYKNLIIVIPLYVSNFTIYEDSMLNIKNWVEKYIIAENKHLLHLPLSIIYEKLINSINYKIFFYTHCNNYTRIKVNNVFKKNKTILGNNLYIYMYESEPIKIKINIENSNIENSNIEKFNIDYQDKMSI